MNTTTTVNPSLDADDRKQLIDSVRRFAERDYGFEARMRALRLPGGFSPDHWRTFAELGWLGIGLPDACGGIGGAIEQALLAEELGRCLVVEPWLTNCALAGPLLAAQGSASQHDLVGRMVSGETQLALAAFERQGRYDAFDVRTQAVATSEGWRLNGAKTLVLNGATADTLLILARESGGQREKDGLSLFAIDAASPGVSVRGLPTYDGRQTADVELRDVAVPASSRVGEAGKAWAGVEAAIDRATVMLCAEAVGAMDRALTMTRDYLRTRKQFGKAITDNQVIRHRLVDMMVAIEQSRAITEAAANGLDSDAAGRRRAVSLAKAFVSSAGRRVGEDSVQLHGAIGMTDDYEVGQCYKRLAATANLFGDAEWHGARLSEAA